MSVTLTLTDQGQSAPQSTATSTLAWLGVSSGVAGGAAAGTPQAVYQFSAPALVAPTVGYGPGAEAVAAGVRISQVTQVFARVNGSVAGSNSAVAQTGTGPLPTLSGAPYDTYTNAKLKVTKAGVLGLAQGQLAMDGGTYGPTFDFPLPTSAAIVGTVDTSQWVSGNYTALNTLTLVVTPANGSVETVTFSGTTAANLLTQVNAVIGPATQTGTVDLTSFTWSGLGTNVLNFTTNDGTVIPVVFATPSNSTAGLLAINTALGAHGTASLVTIASKLYLRIADAITGLASTLTVSPGTANAALGLPATATTAYGAQASIVAGKYLKIVDNTAGSTSALTLSGTALTLLGLTAGSVTGAAPAYVIPNSGLTLTFLVGTYVYGEVYSWTSTEPRFTTTDLVNTMTALQTAQVPFRDIVVLASPIDGTDTRNFAQQLATSLSTWRGAAPRIYALGIMSSAIATPATIAANDLDVKSSMLGMSDSYVAVCHGDVYMAGTAIAGRFRRPACFAIGIRAAAYPISSDPGNREQPALEEAQMLAPDLITLARDEQTAVTKMQSQGFTALKSVLGNAYCVQGLTRSTSASFCYLPIMRTAIQAARVLFTASSRYENADRFLTPQGTLRASDGAAIGQYIYTAVTDALPNDISSCVVTVDVSSVIATTNQLNIQCDIQHKAYFFSVNSMLGVVGAFSSTTTTSATG